MHPSVSFILICTVFLSFDGIFIRETEAQLYGNWTPWTQWTACSLTCGGGNQIRTRTCPQGLGACPGLNQEERICNTGLCQFGNWNQWTPWTACSRTCGSGDQFRTRVCVGGAAIGSCPGLPREQRLCNPNLCHIGNWNQWVPWSACSKTCASGNQFRQRTCIGGAGVGSCPGLAQENRICNAHVCPLGTWSNWVPWSACSRTCAGGNQFRNRVCTGGGGHCPGLNHQQRVCNPGVCTLGGPGHLGPWAQWTQWTVCSTPCGPGQQTRTRACIGGYCPGLPNQERACTHGVCG